MGFEMVLSVLSFHFIYLFTGWQLMSNRYFENDYQKSYKMADLYNINNNRKWLNFSLNRFRRDFKSLWGTKSQCGRMVCWSNILFFQVYMKHNINFNQIKSILTPITPFGVQNGQKKHKKNLCKILSLPRIELRPPGWKVSVSPTRLWRIS